MLKKQIEVNAVYMAKVNGHLTKVRVTSIRKKTDYNGRATTAFYVINLKTGRETVFRSAQKFIRPVTSESAAVVEGAAKQPVNPTPAASTIPTSMKTEAGSWDRSRQTILPFTPASLTAQPTKPSDLAVRLKKKAPAVTPPHVIIEARAGTGKTTTLIEGLKKVKGLPVSITPSPQQAAVWEAMEQSHDATSICLVAFNKSIASELQQRVPAGCDAMTMHSLGYKAVQQALGRQEPNSYVVQDIIAEISETDVRDLKCDEPVLLSATERLVSLCKMNLIGFHFGKTNASGANWEAPCWQEALTDLASYYDVDLNGQAERIFALVPKVLERCKRPEGKITFDDMIWLPIVLDLPVPKYDLLLVDEAQDLNRCQQALALKAGKRLVLCGDDRQAIYGFAGADCESLVRMQGILEDTDRGCVVLPLTVTRRCGRAIVDEARQYVPDFEAHESNPQGIVGGLAFDPAERNNYRLAVDDGDMILCRVNAPLVSECFRFLKAGRKANIQGRDVGQGLISLVKRLHPANVEDLHKRLSDWQSKETAKENAKRHPNDARLIAIEDRYDCLCCFAEDCSTVEEVLEKIEGIFTDDRNGRGIRLSSVHKAKGLEASRVFVLQPEGCGMPHPMAKSSWQVAQEYNLLYVAITRAIVELVYVR